MILDDEWTEGLSPKQQNIIIDYVLNLGNINDMKTHGYKSKKAIKKFINSETGRKAIRRYRNYKFNLLSDTIKLGLAKMYMTRAFFNPGDIITPDGKFVTVNGREIQTLQQLGELVYCIDGIESEIIGVDKITNKPIMKIKIKLCDRNKALDKVGELFQVDKEDSEDLDEKSIFEMSDEERDEEIKKLLEEDSRLKEFAKKIEDKRGGSQDGKDTI